MEASHERYSLLDKFYSEHREEFVAFCANRIGNIWIAEDMVQDVFERLLKLDKMITEVTLPALCYTALRNCLFDYWRHHKVIESAEHFISCNSQMCHPSPESVYNVKEIEEYLEQSISCLSIDKQKIYRMNLYDGLKTSEIADRMQMNYKRVEYSLGVARKEVRNRLKAIS